MNKNNMRKLLSFILCIVLIAAMALTMTACGKSEAQVVDGTIVSDGGEIGKGSKSFAFEVVDIEGETTKFTVKTDKEIVGEALQEVQLIAGEMGPYGLYVKTVNGDTHVYEDGGHYWAFYVNGEYGTSGVDLMPIDETAVYMFKAE